LAKLGILPGAESKDGFANALASKAPGGIQLAPNGSIRRDATVGLAALRRLAVLESNGTLAVERTRALRRYILGLTLVALTAPQDSYLRQGCNLVPDCDKPREFKVVNLDGTRPDAAVSHEEAVKYVRAALKEFRIGKDREEQFDATLAEKAGEAKVEKLNGAVVVSVDGAANKFKAKKGTKKIELSVTSATVITNGEEPATFDTVVVNGAKLDIEHMNGAALKIIGKN
ncbi:hypothetical protein R5W24_005928, partial [Gemmata sp. JC717]|nr:hypothetical protein [Gemmata algarum]